MPELTINGKSITVKAGTTVLEAAQQLGIFIPTLCHLRGFAPEPVCLVCAVRDEASGRTLPACAARAEEGMAVRTDGEAALSARAAALDLLAAEHAGDCESPCRRACPLGVDGDGFIGEFAGAIGAAGARGAAEIILERHPFPAIMGRLCHAPCEKACRRGRRDAAVSIRRLERFAGDAALDLVPARAPATGKKAAVVGAGPAGLAAAYHLLRLGHEVHVFEKEASAGGGLRRAMAGGDTAVLDREAARIAGLGARFRFNCLAGRDIGWEELAGLYHVLLIACGTLPENARPLFFLATGTDGIVVDHETGAASRPGVFAGGSAVKKTDRAVHALRQGREMALGAHGFLLSGAAAAEKKPFDSRLTGLSDEELALMLERSSPGPRHPDGTPAFAPEDASQEARRCLACACLKRPSCVFRRMLTDNGRPRRVRLERRAPFRRDDSHPDAVFEPGKCVKCGRCVRITRARGEAIGLAFIGRGFETAIGVPLGKTLREALTVSTAECVEHCPTAALAWKRGRGKSPNGTNAPKRKE